MRCYSINDRFIDYAHTFLGTPYLWAGDDPSGLDCSGYVIECLKGIGAVHKNFDMSANSLLKKYEAQEEVAPSIGGLFFHIKDSKAYHVGIYIGSGLGWSASGGGKRTTSTEIAWKKNAFIKQHKVRTENVEFVKLFDSETGDLL